MRVVRLHAYREPLAVDAVADLEPPDAWPCGPHAVCRVMTAERAAMAPRRPGRHGEASRSSPGV
jgi:hypothetical protein